MSLMFKRHGWLCFLMLSLSSVNCNFCVAAVKSLVLTEVEFHHSLYSDFYRKDISMHRAEWLTWNKCILVKQASCNNYHTCIIINIKRDLTLVITLYVKFKNIQ